MLEQQEMSLPFEAYCSDDDSVLSDGSSIESDYDESVPATPLDLKDAYFSKAPYPESEPSTQGRTFLRKNETSYANRPPTDNTLAPYAIPPGCSDVRDSFGTMLDEREVVGELVDKNGVVMGEMVENLPPPPDRNYSHMKSHQGNQMLSRVMGYDPTDLFYGVKKEAADPVNPASPLNGDAQLSGSRIAEMEERADRQTFNSMNHTQPFSDVSYGGRDDIYDGYNLKQSAQQRGEMYQGGMMHSWREHNPPAKAPPNPSPPPTQASVRATNKTRRKEMSDTYARKPLIGMSVNIQTLPVATTARVECEGQSSPLVGHSSVEGRREEGKERGTKKAPEAKRPLHKNQGGNVVGKKIEGKVVVSGSSMEMDRVGATKGGDASHSLGEQVHSKTRVEGTDAVGIKEERKGSNVKAQGVVRSVRTRIPFNKEATWHYGGGEMGEAGDVVRSSNCLNGTDASDVSEQGRSKGVEQVSSKGPLVRSVATTRATAGSVFVPDRLSGAKKVEDRTMVERRVDAVHDTENGSRECMLQGRSFAGYEVGHVERWEPEVRLNGVKCRG